MLLVEAQKIIPVEEVLIIATAKRAKELAKGAHPMVSVKREDSRNYLDIALQEIVEKKLLVHTS